MAQALIRHLSHHRVDVSSAGSTPEGEIHPLARLILEENDGIDTSGLHPKSVSGFLEDRFDFVIPVCDKTAERCPVFPGDPERIHWSFEDPAAEAEPDAKRRAFERVANGLSGRLRIWMPLPGIRQRLET